MSAEEIDLVDQILHHEAAPATELPLNRAKRRHGTLSLVLGLLLSFLIGGAGCLGILAGSAVAVTGAYVSKVIPGVHVGGLDVSDMTRDQLNTALASTFAYLGQGDVTVVTPRGQRTLTFAQLGRTPDIEFMANAALQIGHSGNPVLDGITMLQSHFYGESVPVAVRVNSVEVAMEVRALNGATTLAPKNAFVTELSSGPLLSKSTDGASLDETAVTAALVSQLGKVDARAHLQIGRSFITIKPAIGDEQAAIALAAENRMVMDITLTLDPTAPNTTLAGALRPSGSDPSVQAALKTAPPKIKTYMIPASTVRSWIGFGLEADGTYGTTLDTVAIESYLQTLSGTVTVAPVEPTVVFNSAGKPSSVKGGKDGVGMDVHATADAIARYLDDLAGGGLAATVPIVAGPVPPQVNVTSLANFVIMNNGQGQWTTTFYPGITNGNGVNIRQPAKVFNGQVVAPGQTFSFLTRVGPIDPAHGFTWGGVIKGGRSDHTGAMGGGICSASTTMFNAAARAGLAINERHQHYYYIDRYPVGLDATVYSNGYQVWDLRWTNDTPNPIVIRSWATYGGTSKMTVQLWSLPLDRKVTFSAAFKANVVRATNHIVYVTYLKPGQRNWAEYATAGFDTSRTRTVTDATGKVIHRDTWVSHYAKVDGLLEIGKAPTPPTPTP